MRWWVSCEVMSATIRQLDYLIKGISWGLTQNLYRFSILCCWCPHGSSKCCSSRVLLGRIPTGPNDRRTWWTGRLVYSINPRCTAKKVDSLTNENSFGCLRLDLFLDSSIEFLMHRKHWMQCMASQPSSSTQERRENQKPISFDAELVIPFVWSLSYSTTWKGTQAFIALHYLSHWYFSWCHFD